MCIRDSYGDHSGNVPGTAPDQDWPVRPDPFSASRAGFEIRTYRRCQRILMFHRFAELGANPRLVRSLELDYEDLAYAPGLDARAELAWQGSTRAGSLLRRATPFGYADNGSRKSMPPVELTYARPQVVENVQTLAEGSYANLPAGVDDREAQWLDLNSEGLSGVLSEHDGAWWYKPNLGNGRLGPLQRVGQRPSTARPGQTRFLDLDGDGSLDVVALDHPRAGFYERDDRGQWSPFKPFASQPDIAWSDPNLRFSAVRAPLARRARLRFADRLAHGGRRSARAPGGLRRRHRDDLPGRHVGRRTSGSGARAAVPDLLLAEPRLWPL